MYVDGVEVEENSRNLCVADGGELQMKVFDLWCLWLINVRD